eukprot:6839290-Pyramimonas_sp.AAC.1
MEFYAGDGVGATAGSGGDVKVFAGDAYGATGVAGEIFMKAGFAPFADGGDVTISSGDGGTGVSGSVYMYTGDSVSEPASVVTKRPG